MGRMSDGGHGRGRRGWMELTYGLKNKEMAERSERRGTAQTDGEREGGRVRTRWGHTVCKLNRFFTAAG